jgi:hypothetical protein
MTVLFDFWLDEGAIVGLLRPISGLPSILGCLGDETSVEERGVGQASWASCFFSDSYS